MLFFYLDSCHTSSEVPNQGSIFDKKMAFSGKIVGTFLKFLLVKGIFGLNLVTITNEWANNK